MTRETLFFDPYIEYSGSTGNLLYPVPVLVTNYYNSDGNRVNNAADQTEWQLTRRFFLVDNVLFPGPQRREYSCSLMIAGA